VEDEKEIAKSASVLAFVPLSRLHCVDDLDLQIQTGRLKMPSIGKKPTKPDRMERGPTRDANGNVLTADEERRHFKKKLQIAEKEISLLRERLSFVDERKV